MPFFGVPFFDKKINFGVSFLLKSLLLKSQEFINFRVSF